VNDQGSRQAYEFREGSHGRGAQNNFIMDITRPYGTR
jgi:hypothetical protein